MAHKNPERRRQYVREWQRKRRITHPGCERAKQQRSERKRSRKMSDPKFWLSVKYVMTRSNARTRGLAFTLSKDEWLRLSTPAYCPILGIPLKYGRGKISADMASVDRQNSALGYVPGNVRVISYRANALRSNATAAELRAVLQDVEWQEFLRS